MLHGEGTLALTKTQGAELEVVELKMLMFSSGVTRMDGIKNKHIRQTSRVRHLRDKERDARLR